VSDGKPIIRLGFIIKAKKDVQIRNCSIRLLEQLHVLTWMKSAIAL